MNIVRLVGGCSIMTKRKPLGTPKFKGMKQPSKEKYKEKISILKTRTTLKSDYEAYCKKIEENGGTPLSYNKWLYNVDREFNR
jgi:hypothetical protein